MPQDKRDPNEFHGTREQCFAWLRQRGFELRGLDGWCKPDHGAIVYHQGHGDWLSEVREWGGGHFIARTFPLDK